jgi:hypothetical protein
LEVSRSTIERVRRRFVDQGLDAAITRRCPRREYRMRLEGEQEAYLVALACTPPPVGLRHESLRLLADKLVELGHIAGVSYQTVRQVLKTNQLKPWLTRRWCIPPKAHGELVWRMRVQRHATVAERRTRVDWAHVVRYSGAEKLIPVQDNLNTHTPGSLRGISSRRGQAPSRQAGDPLHPKAGKLAEHRGDRAEHDGWPVPGPPHPRPGNARTGGGGMGDGAQYPRMPGELALHD